MEYDYEEIEERLGAKLRERNFVNLPAGIFLPVKFIGRLMEFTESLTQEVARTDADVRVNILNKEFGRWIDDMIAQLRLTVISSVSPEAVHCELIDVESMRIEPGKALTVTLSGDRGEHQVLDEDGNPLMVNDVDELQLEGDFNRLLDHDLEGIDYLGSLLIRGAMAMKKELTAEMFDDFSDRFFEYFKFDLERLTPAILEDLQSISDHRLVQLFVLVD
ncbi:MAG: hypothetical protein K2O00_09420 [Muribaculaceae bacterium]|nr:hypothetical protein [Muribaculaceae bacterium]